jgi:ribosomal protein L21E
MTDLQQYNSQDEANKLLKLYADKVYISIDPSMEEWEMEKVQSMFVGLLAVIAGWSTVPIP